MTEFFITARSFAAPFVSDTSEGYIEAATPREALERYAADYGHPFGLYAAEAWTNADAYHKGQEFLAQWLSNHAYELRKLAEARGGGYSVKSNGPGDFEFDGKRVVVKNPKGGAVRDA